MIATRSLIPLLAMKDFSLASTPRARLPEIVANPVGGKEPAKRHLDFLANRDFVRLAVGHLAQQTAAAVEFNYDVNSGGMERIGEPIYRVSGDFSDPIRKSIRLHLAALMAFDADQ